jgi:hypothetical protein
MRVSLFKCLFVFIVTSVCNSNAYALRFNKSPEYDTLDLRNNRLKLLQLPKKNVRDCIYNVTPKVKMVNTLIWEREISMAANDQLLVKQRCLFTDTTQNRISTTLFDARTLRPIFQKAEKNKRINAFNFSGNEIKRTDSGSSNFVSEDFEVRTDVMPYNWETDFMVFSSLPFKRGRDFVIRFYHPGSRRSPDYYHYKFVGIERLKSIAGQPVTCWKIRIDYSETSWAEFWIDKKTIKLPSP